MMIRFLFRTPRSARRRSSTTACSCLLAVLIGPAMLRAQSPGAYADLHNFGGTVTNANGLLGHDGATPFGGVAVDKSGDLFGTTVSGGRTNASGMLWEITAAGAYKDLHDFAFTAVVHPDDTSGLDGADPAGGVTIDSAGDLFGTLLDGGEYQGGMLWEFTASGTYKDLHDFGGRVTDSDGLAGPDGSSPFAGVTLSGGNLYGTTEQGGRHLVTGSGSAGIVWELTSASTYRDLHDFNGTVTNAGGTSGPDGTEPEGTVAVDSGGDVFGTTYTGGPNQRTSPSEGCGVAWEITKAGAYKDLHDFGGTVVNADGVSGPDGNLPMVGVALDSVGDLFGTTTSGGANLFGTIWAITSSGTYKDLHDFDGTIVDTAGNASGDGLTPEGGVTLDSAGDLYGTAVSGGPNNDGILWELMVSGAYKDLHDFGGTAANTGGTTGPDGTAPGALTFDASGNIYGTASGGGGGAAGMAWKITPETSYLLVTAPATASAGKPFTFTVTGEDADGNAVLTYSGLLHFSSSDSAATLPPNQFIPSGGVGVYTADLKTSGPQTITATDVYLPVITGMSASIAVGAGGASHFVVAAPASASAGMSFTFTVTAEDVYGNPVPTYGGLLHFKSTDPQAVLPPNQFFPAGGVATFTAILGTAGPQTITASDVYLPVLTGTSGSIAVAPGGTSHLVVSAPASATVGTSFTFSVTAKDAYGNTVPTYSGLLQFDSTDGHALLPPNQFFPAGGVGTFTMTLETIGSQTVTASDVYLPVITGMSNGIATGN
jgi:hypothetical protein